MTAIKPETGDCPFCADIFAANAFMSDGRFLAVYNVAPILPGHSLVVPRRHTTSISELSDEETAGLFIFARKATDLLIRAFDGHGFNWSLQEGKSAGQTVAHLHLHLVIRRKDDLANAGDWYPLVEEAEQTMLESNNRKKLGDTEYARISEHLRKLTAGPIH